ncbi:hypothetical protein F511_23831 [Dorcoceras hygrometricum]|uniref:Dystroglycan-like n=1 Tax=Dorcoceras hygrometricum TaxID=472368 RepID=A0A2Z7C0T2_9LAMI|nr:hypothetical protein F511_23831 [Dorcoceras hygrometricum]
MAASLYVNTLQVKFESVLAMEHTEMAHLFKSLVDTGLEGFLAVSDSVYEAAVVEFFANAKIIAGTIVSFVANRKLVISKEYFNKTFGFPTEGVTSFLDVPKETVVEMRSRFSGSDVPFRTPNKKREMKMEFQLLHDIVAKALCAKAGSFDIVTSEKFDLMVTISAGLIVNWGQLLFQVLKNMVNNPKRKSQGFAVTELVKDNLGESVKLHPQKVLTSKSVHTYIKKNHEVEPTGEFNQQTGDTSSGTEGGQSKITKTVEPNPILEIPAGGRQAFNTGESEAHIESTSALETRADDESINCGPEGYVLTTAEQAGDIAQDEPENFTSGCSEGQTCEFEDWVEKVTGTEREESTYQREAKSISHDRAIVVRSEPAQPAQPSLTFTGLGIFTPIEIREINWVTYFQPKIDPATKDRGHHKWIDGGQSKITKTLEVQAIAQEVKKKKRGNKQVLEKKRKLQRLRFVPASRIKDMGAKLKKGVESPNLETTISVAPVQYTKKNRTKRNEAFNAGELEVHIESTPALETRAGDGSIRCGPNRHVWTIADQAGGIFGSYSTGETHDERMENETQTDKGGQAENIGDIAQDEQENFIVGCPEGQTCRSAGPLDASAGGSS